MTKRRRGAGRAREGRAPRKGGLVALHEPLQRALHRVELVDQIRLPVPVALLEPHRFGGVEAEMGETERLAGAAERGVDGLGRRDRHMELPGPLAGEADGHRNGFGLPDPHRLHPEPGKAGRGPVGLRRDRGQERRCLRPRDHQDGVGLGQGAQRDRTVAGQMRAQPVEIVQLRRRGRAPPERARVEIGDGRLAEHHALAGERVAEADAPRPLRRAPAEEAVHPVPRALARDLDAGETVDLHEADTLLHRRNLRADRAVPVGPAIDMVLLEAGFGLVEARPLPAIDHREGRALRGQERGQGRGALGRARRAGARAGDGSGTRSGSPPPPSAP